MPGDRRPDRPGDRRGASEIDARLRVRLAEPGWTPGARDVPALLDALTDAEDAAPLERALVRRADLAGPQAVARSTDGPPAARVRLLRLLGRLIAAGAAPDGAADAAIAALADGEPAVRRQAARALAALRQPPPEVAAALAAALAREARPEVHRALVESLGKTGGAVAEAALAAIGPAGDASDADRAGLERARRWAARGALREEGSAIDLVAALPAPTTVELHCRRGLAPLLAGELAGLAPRVLDPTRVALRTSSLARPAEVRLALRLGIPLAPVERGEPAATVAATLTAPPTRALLARLTRGPIRYRLAWRDGGHRRALTQAVAAEVARAAPELINDPVAATWQVHVDLGRRVAVELEPRRIGEARFAYRVRDVPAASHPTIAAALARLAVAHSPAPAADVVWDPFAGSAVELIERARLAPFAALHGTDLSTDALAAARANLDAAGVVASLTHADATRHRIAGLTSIVSNPPMGRRVARGDARELLDRFLNHAAALLAPGGVLTWISPFPRDTRARAAALGLTLREAHPIDMGGFDGEVQVLAR